MYTMPNSQLAGVNFVKGVGILIREVSQQLHVGGMRECNNVCIRSQRLMEVFYCLYHTAAPCHEQLQS